MSLAPIPSRMLHDSVEFYVPVSQDRWQDKTYQVHTVDHVHLQADHTVLKSTNNEEIQLRGVLFVDGRRSSPQLDMQALQDAALAVGDTMRAKVYDASGQLLGDFAVLTVDGLPDVPATRIHHWELGVV